MMKEKLIALVKKVSISKKLILLATAAIFMLIGTVNASAGSAVTYGSPTSTGTYNIKDNITIGSNTHHVYQNTYNWNMRYNNRKLCPPIYRIMNSGALDLRITNSQVDSAIATVNWAGNPSIGTQMGSSSALFSESVSAAVKAGCGESSARKYSFVASNTVIRTIPSSAATGYYCMVPGHTFRRVEDIIIGSGGKYTTIYYDIPYGEAVIYSLYSSDNSSYSIY